MTIVQDHNSLSEQTIDMNQAVMFEVIDIRGFESCMLRCTAVCWGQRQLEMVRTKGGMKVSEADNGLVEKGLRDLVLA